MPVPQWSTLLYAGCLRLLSVLRVPRVPGRSRAHVRGDEAHVVDASASGCRPTAGTSSARPSPATCVRSVATRSCMRRQRGEPPQPAWTFPRCTANCSDACQPRTWARQSSQSWCRGPRCRRRSAYRVGFGNFSRSRSTRWTRTASWSITHGQVRESHRSHGGAGQRVGVGGSRVAGGHRVTDAEGAP